MSVYSYLALDEKGIEQKGKVEAPSERAAADMLRRRSWFVIRIWEGSGFGETLKGAFRRNDAARDTVRPGLGLTIGAVLPVRSRDLIFFFQIMSLMVRSGHTVTQGLDVAAGLTRSPRLRIATQRMSRAILGGSGFAAAMAQERRVFDPLMSNLVSSGEQSGQLEFALDQVAENIGRSVDLRSRVLAAITYPSLVALVTIGVVVFMMAYAVPRISEFFATRRVALPWMLSTLIDTSEWFAAYGKDIAIGTGLVVFALLAAYTTKRGKEMIDPALLWVPVIGPSLQMTAMSRLGTNFAMLLRSGLTVLESLRVLEKVMTNHAHTDAMQRAGQQILAGRNLGAGLEHRYIPSLLRHMASVGERSGELESTMQEVGQFYRKRLDYRVDAIINWILPILTLIVGGTVGFIYFAIFQAVLQASGGFR